jgi:hypothetical protein
MAGDRYLDPEFEDTELPERPELAALAHAAELEASALPVSAVRRLGARRRRRRHAAIGAGALALVVLAGSVAAGSTGALFTQDPPVVASPTPTTGPVPGPTPTGPIEAVNELRVEDVPHRAGVERVTKIDSADVGSVTSACVGGGLDSQVGSWGFESAFRVRPTDPAVTPDPQAPVFGTLVLAQLVGTQNAAEGSSVFASVRRQVEACPRSLAGRGFTVLGGSTVTWVDVDPGVDGSRGGYATVVYRTPGDRSEEGWFESIGVTQYRERLMVTVRLAYGSDDSWSERPGGDPAGGLAENPQFGLIAASAKRLRA